MAGVIPTIEHVQRWAEPFVDNLLDEVYVAARRPSGARPGLPRTIYVGVQVEL